MTRKRSRGIFTEGPTGWVKQEGIKEYACSWKLKTLLGCPLLNSYGWNMILSF